MDGIAARLGNSTAPQSRTTIAGESRSGGPATTRTSSVTFRTRLTSASVSVTADADEGCRPTPRAPRAVGHFEPIGPAQSLYEDRVEYAVPGGRLVRRLTSSMLRLLLTRAFAQRHRIVGAAVEDAANVPAAFATVCLAGTTPSVALVNRDDGP